MLHCCCDEVDRDQRNMRNDRQLRTNDAGPAMDHHRRLAVPAAHEGEELPDMVLPGEDMAVDRLADVGHAEEEVALSRDAGRARDHCADIDQGHEMAGAHRGDGFAQPGERGDVKAWQEAGSGCFGARPMRQTIA